MSSGAGNAFLEGRKIEKEIPLHLLSLGWSEAGNSKKLISDLPT
jgi:hypothetical protein